MPSVSLLENAYANTRAKYAEEQQDLYRRVWATTPTYGTGADYVQRALPRIVEHIETHYPRRADSNRPTVIDFGAGNGIYLTSLLGAGAVSAPAVGVDLVAPKTVPPGVEWKVSPMWEDTGARAGFAISMDALEHLPTPMVTESLRTIRAAAPHGFIRIATRKDSHGTRFGSPLHLTVKQPEWWIHQFLEIGFPISRYAVEVGQAVEIQY